MNIELRAAREKAGLTQSRVAEQANISVLAYYRYEHNQREPGVRTAIRIAKALNRSVEELFGTATSNNSHVPDGNQAKNWTSKQYHISTHPAIPTQESTA